MRGILRLLLVAVLLGASPRVRAEAPLVVIVHPDSGIVRLSRDEVANIYMGRQKRFPSGLVALPVEPLEPKEVRARFYGALVHMPLAKVRSYWAQLYFSGQAQPPQQVASPEEVLDLVAANKGALGFLPQNLVNGRVRVVLVVPVP